MIGATSPSARVSAKDRVPPTPVIHLCRAKGRFGIRKSYSWSETDQPLQVDLGFWVGSQARDGLLAGEACRSRRIHQTYLGGVERGKRNPMIAVLPRIPRALGADIDDLVNPMAGVSF